MIPVCFGLVGCAGNPSVPPGDWDFRVTGKLAVRDADKGHSARFEWRQLGTDYDIEVWGPLGQGRTQLVGNADSMVVTRGNELLANGHPDDVMMRHLGWVVPVDALPAWLRGDPYAGLTVSHVVEDETGRRSEFRQADWTVGFDRYKEFAGKSRPGRITAVRGDYRVRVVIGAFNE